ncbi:ferredoxin [Nocardioides aromaticivorans]|uniref:Ferredoxin n=2 Tax=Actinomycetes TaxID=1760 RepID=A0A7Z0CRD9_9ACTN|nr:ferredoxin [Nocardioides aromaticivorans]NYI47807.1 ferredoxin [Nocardioides aromaticivorans]BAC54160.1 ferredoxin of phthalate dioxygenase [Terrabacter sp. DBF63]BAE45086.1 phthalate 3,4-dioxygenase ferredoxin component [Terrabacter sp. DBF63]
MPRLLADVKACQGYGNCITGAPDAYDIDDDGKVVLLTEEISDADRPRVEEAARSCPANALSIED